MVLDAVVYKSWTRPARSAAWLMTWCKTVCGCPPGSGYLAAFLAARPAGPGSNLDRAPLSGAVAHGADRWYAGVRVAVAGASQSGHQATAAKFQAPIRAVHDRSYASAFPPGGLHPIGADHCPEREPSRAWSAGLPRCFWPCRGSAREVCMSAEGRGQRILEPLTAPVEG